MPVTVPVTTRPTRARRPSSASRRSRWPTTPARCSTRASTPSSGSTLGTYGICESCGNPIGKTSPSGLPSCDPMQVMQAEAGAPLIPPPAPDASPTPSSAVPVNPDRRPPCDRDARLFAVLVAAAVTVYTADQLTKAWAAATLPPEQPRHLIGSAAAAQPHPQPRGGVLDRHRLHVRSSPLVACSRRRGDRAPPAAASAACGGPGPSACCSAARWATSPTGWSARPGPAAGTSSTSCSCRTGRSSTSPTRRSVTAAVLIALLALRGIGVDGRGRGARAQALHQRGAARC